MKQYHKILILIATLMPVIVFGQIEKEIRSYADSSMNQTDTMQIYFDNGRLMLVHSIYENDLGKAVEIKNFLDEQFRDSIYSPFNYHQELILNLLTNQWDALDNLIRDYENYNNSYLPVKGSNVFITSVLFDRAREEIETLKVTLECSGLEQDAMDAVSVFLLYLDPYADEDAFVKKRKEISGNPSISPYLPFLNRFLPGDPTYVSTGISVGGGVTLLTGGLNKNYLADATFNIAMEYDIEKFYWSFGFRLGALKLTEPYEISEPFEYNFDEGYNFMFQMFALKFGYSIVRNKNLHVTPYAYCSYAMLYSQEFVDDTEGKEYYDMKAFSFGPGIHTEIKLFEFEHSSLKRMNSEPMDNVITLQLNTGYNFNLGFNRPEVKGNLIYFDIGLTYRMGTL